MTQAYRPYTVVLSFSGECCTYPHLWVQLVRARSVEEARRRAAAIVTRGGRVPYETSVFPGMPRYDSVEELPSSYWSEKPRQDERE